MHRVCAQVGQRAGMGGEGPPQGMETNNLLACTRSGIKTPSRAMPAANGKPAQVAEPYGEGTGPVQRCARSYQE